jgi:hypothetical protein
MEEATSRLRFAAFAAGIAVTKKIDPPTETPIRRFLPTVGQALGQMALEGKVSERFDHAALASPEIA